MELLLKTLKLLAIGFVLLCFLLYFFQEKLIFFPEKLDKQYSFSFDQPFEELYITTKDSKQLNALLFKADSSKGLVFYLHGNAGALNSWGEVAKRYTDLNYDVFILDYRGFGKSEGSINNQNQLLDDVQTAYSAMKKRYAENKIVVLGYSLGTGPAAKVASVNQPKLLILQAPYYSLKDVAKQTYPLLPTFLLKYPLETYRYIKDCKMPIVIFHGTEDAVIRFNASTRLKALLKNTDTLITLHGQGHNGVTDNPAYIHAINELLSE